MPMRPIPSLRRRIAPRGAAPSLRQSGACLILWHLRARLWRRLEQRQGDLSVLHGRSHRTPQQVLEGIIPPLHWAANIVADCMAGDLAAV